MFLISKLNDNIHTVTNSHYSIGVTKLKIIIFFCQIIRKRLSSIPESLFIAKIETSFLGIG